MPSAPKAPDPQATAAAQAQANQQAVYDSARVNQINENDVYGSRKFTGDIGSPNRTVTDTLSPDEQKKYDLLNQVIFGAGSHVNNRLDQITDQPFSLNGAPAQQFGGYQTGVAKANQGPTAADREAINQEWGAKRGAFQGSDADFLNSPDGAALTAKLNNYYASSNDPSEIAGQLAFQQGRINDPLYGASAQQDVNTLQQRQQYLKDNPQYFGDTLPIQTDFGRAPGVQRSLDMSGVTPLAGTGDFSSDRQRVEDALYQRQTARLDPQFATEQNAMETQLANQGITQTSNPAAWQQAMDQFARNKNDAYSSARNDAIGQSATTQQQLFGQSLAARGQTFGEAATAGGFVNQAQGQQFGQNLGGAQFKNQAQDQAYGQSVNDLQMFNQATAQNQDSTNAARNQYINELLMSRSQPLNELNALMSGNQVTAPQFGQISQYTMAAPDIGGYITNNYNQQMAGRNAMIGAIGGAVGAAGGMAMKCWVAREVYGADNPKWLKMRDWMTDKAPKALHDFYMRHGPDIAAFIADKPHWKVKIRSAMDDVMVAA